MTLVMAGPLTTQIWEALLIISGCDAGLEQHGRADGTLAVTFQPANSPSKFAQRLGAIIDAGRWTTLYGVDSSYMDIRFGLITDLGGISILDSTPGKLNEVYIDVTQAGGRGYRVPAPDGVNLVAEPTASIVYHEFAHVYHFTIAGDAPKDYEGQQTQAIQDENEFRDSVGLPRRMPVDPAEYFYNQGPPTVGIDFIKGCNDGRSITLDRFCREVGRRLSGG